MWSATRLTASTFGLLAGLGGLRHGIGEVQQGNVRPDGLFIESWTSGPIAEHMDGEPGLTIVPNMVATGVLALIASVAVVVWAAWFVQRRHGGLTLTAFSVVMLLVGGGVGPPVVGMLAGWPGHATGTPERAWPARLPASMRRALASSWPLVFALAAANGLFLFVISLALLFWFDVTNADLFLWSFYLSVVLLVAASMGAIARDAAGRSLVVSGEVR
ncbi:MAG: hypothetical protein R3C39_09105 [Dehalococcoidia bacterium]